MPDVVLTRLLGEAAHRHVLDHAGAQRADAPVGKIGGHRGFLSRAKGCWTLDARDRMPRPSRLTAYSAQNARTITPAFPRERVRSLAAKQPSRPSGAIRLDDGESEAGNATPSTEMHALDEPISAQRASTKRRGAIEEHARRQAPDRQHDRQHEADRDYLPQLHPNVEAAERTDQGPAGKSEQRERIGAK